VDSVLRQTHCDFELLVIDDGSADDTVQILDPLIKAKKLTYLFQDNLGVSAARNEGILKAQGEWITFLDSDDEWLPDKLAAQIADLRRNPQVLISQCQEIWYRKGRRVNPGQKHRKTPGDIFFESIKLCLISPSAVIIRADVFQEVGLFDELLPACEDYDLWLRITAGHQVGLLDQNLVIRYGGREDQLSEQSGLDLYRLKALKKILNSGHLNTLQRAAVSEEMARRYKILADGCRKRGFIVPEI
jgi:glycosyltransferase involved in cell wall biosynthesis